MGIGRKQGWKTKKNKGSRTDSAAGGVDSDAVRCKPASLACTPAGHGVAVSAVKADRCHAQRLRELGIIEGRTIEVLAAGNPLICRVGDCRLGICRRLAECVLVEPVVDRVAAKSA